MQKTTFEMLKNTLLPLIVFGSLLFAVMKFRFVLMNPMSWFIIACLVFLICCGGIVHNILHHVPLTGVSRGANGEIEYEYISTGVPHSN